MVLDPTKNVSDASADFQAASYLLPLFLSSLFSKDTLKVKTESRSPGTVSLYCSRLRRGISRFRVFILFTLIRTAGRVSRILQLMLSLSAFFSARQSLRGTPPRGTMNSRIFGLQFSTYCIQKKSKFGQSGLVQKSFYFRKQLCSSKMKREKSLLPGII